jgi:hypothetical protein
MAASSKPAALQKHPQQQRQRQAEPDEEQPVGGEHADADMDHVPQAGRRRQAQNGATPDRLHKVEEHEGEAEGQQHLVHVAAPVKRPHEQKLRHDPDDGHGQRRDNQGDPEIVRGLEDRQAEKRAQHEERAVRQAHHVHQPEDERQARCHQKQQHAIDQPVQELGSDEVHKAFTCSGSTAADQTMIRKKSIPD